MARTLLDLNFNGARPFDASGIGSLIRASGLDLVVTVTDWEQPTEANVSTTVVES